MRDDSLIFAANRTTEAGAVGGFLAWLGSLNWIGLLGLLIAVLGYLTSLYFQVKRNRREQREHDLRVQGLLGDRRSEDVPVRRDRRRQDGKISPRLAGMLAASGVGLLTAAGLITDWESGPQRPLTAYRDIVGVWTICDGITRGVKSGQRATDEQCDQKLYAELKRVDMDILGCLNNSVPQQSRAAVISLAYNAGTNAVCRSTMVRKLNAGDTRGGCLELRRWVYAGGQRVQGLANRREAELAVCLQGAA